MRRSTLAALAIAVAATPAAAQQRPAVAAGPYARIVTIEPKPGQAQAFEAGYQRHLEWHRAANDPWTWYGWSFVLGDRIGMFMDGTFGHAADDFDRAVQPAADAADNAVNVSPHADFRTHGVYERLDALGKGPLLPDTSAYLAMTTYRVRPGKEREFTSAIAAGQRVVSGRWSWYRLRIGGEGPTYVLMRPASSWAEAAALPDFLGDAPGTELDDVIDCVRSELLRYRPNLSYHP